MSTPETTYYAIGDVHGEAERLAKLHEVILADAAGREGPAMIIHLGDLVDRGADSRAAVALAMGLQARCPPGVSTLTLRGNHEQMMIDALATRADSDVRQWFNNGGRAALASYVATHDEAVASGDWADAIDAEHLAFLRAAPTLYTDEARKLAFVHAGVDLRTFPNCTDEIRQWTRSPRFYRGDDWPERPELEGWRFIHGHTPTKTDDPEETPWRINVDTGACFGGPLTCVVLPPGEEPGYFQIYARS